MRGIHFGEKHDCVICGKQFTRTSSLTIHMRIHSEIDTSLIHTVSMGSEWEVAQWATRMLGSVRDFSCVLMLVDK